MLLILLCPKYEIFLNIKSIIRYQSSNLLPYIIPSSPQELVDERNALLILSLALLCSPLLLLNCQYKNSSSAKARSYYQVSMGLLMFHWGCVGVLCCMTVMVYIGAAASG